MMMEDEMGRIIIIVLVLFLLILIGFVLKRLNITKLMDRLKFTVEYNNSLVELLNEFVQSKRINHQKYLWLTERVNSMQRELGDTGVIHHYSDPLKGFTVREYQLLINFLPEISGYIHEFDNSIMMRRFNDSAQWCTDMFVRHQGDLNEAIEKENKQLLNPFSCFAEGIRYIVSLPFKILYWLGILSESTLYRIKNSWFLRFVNTVVILISLIGSIMTIVLGWEGFIKTLEVYLPL